MYICSMKGQGVDKVKEKIGEWLMDISKYMVTAMLLTSVFGNMEQPWLFWIAIFVAALVFVLGVYLIKVSNDNNSKKRRQ